MRIAIFIISLHGSFYRAAGSSRDTKIWHGPRKLHQPQRRRHGHSNLFTIRGGQSADPNNYPNYDQTIPYSESLSPDGSLHQETVPVSAIDQGFPPPALELEDPVPASVQVQGNGQSILPSFMEQEEDPFHETVQQRVETWRNAQQQKYQDLSPEERMNPRDDQGRVKLLVSVTKGSRAMVFFLMMWRDIHLYEMADQSLKGLTRAIFVIPLVALFIGNLAGIIASFSSPVHSAKKRLKAILNIDKLLEAVLLVWYFIRLTVAPPKYIPRETFIVNTFHSILFILVCQGCTKFTWYETF